MLQAKLKSLDRQRFGLILIVGLGLLGILVRLAPLVAHRFHQDEAIYSHWALQVTTGRDPWLSHFPVDKPPLFIYILALFFNLFGASESVARLPSELASVLSLLVVYALARQLYGPPAALVALALMVASPLNILFAPTALTDPLMVALVWAALWVAATHRWAWSGVLLGLAFICKPQAALFLPLVVTFNLLADSGPAEAGDAGRAATWPARWRARWTALPAPARRGLAFALGCGLAVAPAFAWDALRTQRPGFLEQSAISYGGLAWAPVTQWVERAGQWREILSYVTAAPVLDTILLAGTPVLLAFGGLVRRDRRVWTDLSLVLFSAFYLAAHTFINFNVWDRYMLPLAPCLLLLLARALTLPLEAISTVARKTPRIAPLRAARPSRSQHRGSQHRGSQHRGLLGGVLGGVPDWVAGLAVATLLLLTTLRPAQDAAASRFPIGGDHGAYDGFTDLVAYFRGHVPGGSILYHQWLGWHYSFYLFDFPYQFQYYATPEELTAHAAAHAAAPRFVAFPSWTSSTQVAWRLKQAGLTLRPIYETYRDDGSASFTLHRIEEAAP